MDINIWSKVGVDVQTALASPKTISAISKANPAVASSTAHGYTAGDILLLKTVGMPQLNWRVVRVASSPTTDSFTLEGIDSTEFDTFISGTAEEVTLGASASTLQDITPSGGEAADIPISTIHTDQDFSLPGNFSPVVFAFTSLWVPNDPALKALSAFGAVKSACVVGIRFATGTKVYFAAFPSASMAPGGSAGGAVTTPLTLRLRGLLTTVEG